MKLVVIALVGARLAVAGGCGSKQKDPAQACAEAAKQGVDTMIDQARGRIAAAQLPEDVRARVIERQTRLEGAGGKMRAVFTNRCVDDKWSRAVIGCYVKVKSLDEMRACRTQLTPEQQAKLQRDELDLLAGASGPPGFDQRDPNGPFNTPADPRLVTIDRAINDARKVVADAKHESDLQTARAQLAALIEERKQLEAKIAALPTP